MSKVVQELITKFNSKNVNDKIQKEPKEQKEQKESKEKKEQKEKAQTEFKKKINDFINNQTKANDKKIITPSHTNNDIKKENNKPKEVGKSGEKAIIKETDKEKTKEKESEKEKTKDILENIKENVIEKLKENIDPKRKSEIILNNNKEDSDIQFHRDKRMTLSKNNNISNLLMKRTKTMLKYREKEPKPKLEILDDDVYTFNEEFFINRKYDKNNVDSGKKFFKLRFLKQKLDSFNSNINNMNIKEEKDEPQLNVEKERYLRQYNSDFILTLEKSILSFNVKNYKDSYEILINSGIIKNINEYGEFLLVVGGFDKFLIGEFLAKQKYPNDKKEVLNNFIESINMEYPDKSFLDCLRFLFTRLNLPKDANLILEIVDKFSVNYFEVNNMYDEFVETFKSSDKVYLLISTILALNTMFTRKDIKIKNVIKKEEFIKMNADLSKEFLEKIYNELKKNPISITIDDKIELIYKKLASLAGEGEANSLESKSTNSLASLESDKNNNIKIEDKSEENKNSRLKSCEKLIKIDSDKINEDEDYFDSNLKEEEKTILKTPQKLYRINKGKKSDIREYVFSDNFTKLYYLAKPKKALDISKLLDIFNGSEHSHNSDIIKYLKSNPSEEPLSNNFVSLIFENEQLDLMSDNLDAAMRWYKAVKNLFIINKNRNKSIINNMAKTQLEIEIEELIGNIWELILNKWNIYGGYLTLKLMERNMYANNALKILNQFEQKKFSDKNIKSFLKSIEGKLSKEKEIEYSDFINLYFIGLPHQTRKSLWQILIGNACGITENTYETYKRKIPPIDFKNLNMDKNSYDNSYSNDNLSNQIIQEIININEIFSEEMTNKNMDKYDIMNKVYNISRSFFIFRQDFSFNKNLISIIFPLLFIFEGEADTFINLINLICSNLYSIFLGEENEIKAYSVFFNSLLKKYIPKISKLFEKMEITPELYLIPWFEEFFTKTFNLNILNHIFDLFLINGEYIFFQAGLSIIKLLEDELPNSTINEIFKSLKRVSNDITQINFMYIFQSFDKVKKDVSEWKSENEIAKQKINLFTIIFSS